MGEILYGEKYDKLFEAFSEKDANAGWLLKNYEWVSGKYDSEFVAVIDRKVVAHDKNIHKLIKRIETNYKLKDAYIEYVKKEGVKLVLCV